MSARRGNCSISSRKGLALCLLGGMSATPVSAGPLAMLGFGAKGNNAQALAIPNTKRNIRMNVSQYANAALEVLDMKYGKCLEKAANGGMLAPTAQSCLAELSENRKQVMAINLKQEATELANALQQQESRANANIKAEQVNLRKNAEIEKAKINKQIASLKKKGELANAKLLANLERRARAAQNTINKYGGAIVKGFVEEGANIVAEGAGIVVGGIPARAAKTFMRKTGLSETATALVFAAALCAGAIGMIAAAQLTVLSTFTKIMGMIKRILMAGAMAPVTLIKKLIGTTINYVRATRSNRTTAQINRNISRVASPVASARGSRGSRGSRASASDPERTITLLGPNNSPSGSTATSSRSGVTTRSQSSRNTASSSGASSRRTASRRTASRR